MAGLFGSAAASSSSAANASAGDLKNDVALKDIPEDSVSDLAFSPQSDHLAVASWDKKVRIYEISANGDSQGKALFEHEGPVMSCAWSRVSTKLDDLRRIDPALIYPPRTAAKSLVAVPTKPPASSTSPPAMSPTQLKSLPTKRPSAASKCSTTTVPPC